MNKFYHRLLQSSEYRRSSGTTNKSKLRQITTSHVVVFTKNCTKIIRLNIVVGRSHNNNIFMWRPHTYEKACFEMEFGKPRYASFIFDMCLTLRSLVSRLVPLLLCRRSKFARPQISISNWSWKQTNPPNKVGTKLETKLLKVRHMSKLKFV